MKGEEKWLVDNPGSPILFNSEDYEDNPRRRKRGRRRKLKAVVMKPKRHRRRKAGRKTGRKVGRKATKRSKRRGKRPFTFLKAWKKRRTRKYRPFKTPKGTTFFMGPKAKYEENAWKGQRKRHRRAARKGWKRHPRRRRSRKHKEYAANPVRRHRRRKAFSFNFASNPKKRYSRRRHYSSNPVMGGIGAKLTGGKFYHLPKMSELKGQGAVKSILYGAGGLITTSLIGMGIEYGMKQAKLDKEEWMVDAGRIFGKVALGSMISWGIGRATKSNVAAKTWQTGVYIATGLDIAGTIFKYAQRGFKGIKMGGAIRPPLTTGNIIMGAFGMGSIQQAYFEGQIADAIIKTGRVEIVGNEKGHIGLMHPGTGKIILSGPEKQMAPILGAVQKIMVKTGQDREEDRGIFGEDITIEA